MVKLHVIASASVCDHLYKLFSKIEGLNVMKNTRFYGGMLIQKKTYPHPYDEVFEVSLKSIQELGWNLVSHNKAAGEIKAKTGTTLKSWGEDISIHVTREAATETTISVLSQASFQLFAWGKNEENERAFHMELEKLISR